MGSRVLCVIKAVTTQKGPQGWTTSAHELKENWCVFIFPWFSSCTECVYVWIGGEGGLICMQLQVQMCGCVPYHVAAGVRGQAQALLPRNHPPCLPRWATLAGLGSQTRKGWAAQGTQEMCVYVHATMPGLFGFLSFIFSLCMCSCLWVCAWCADTHRSLGHQISPETGVIDDFKPPAVGVKNQGWVLCKSSACC